VGIGNGNGNGGVNANGEMGIVEFVYVCVIAAFIPKKSICKKGFRRREKTLPNNNPS
jgi:hypothetical protein